jgi:hypothetical protein
MKGDHQHIIETILEATALHTISKPKSNWRLKVYPPPKLWITKETLKLKSVYNNER